jgi:IS1 family transposase
LVPGSRISSLTCKRLQVDEIWGFVGAKAKNANPAKKAAGEAGDAWLWLATDADTKLVPCWHVGTRDGDAAMEFVDDLSSRLANRVQITTDGHKAYLYAVDAAFGGEVDFAQLLSCTALLQRAPRAVTAPPNARESLRPVSLATRI